MRLSVARADSAAERNRVFAFRYRLAHDEMGLPLPDADHARSRLIDALDDDSVSYALLERGEVVRGELRLTLLEKVADPAPLIARFALEPALTAFGRPAICAARRFMLDPRLADGSALPELLELAYEDARRRARICYAAASPHLVPFY